MKNTILSLILILSYAIAHAQVATNKPIGIVEVPADGVDVTTRTFGASIGRIPVLKSEALQKVFKTTDTVIRSRTRIIFYIDGNDQLTTRTQTVNLIKTTTTSQFNLRLKPGYFLDPSGIFFKTTDTLTKGTP